MPVYVGDQFIGRVFVGAEEIHRKVFDATDIRGKERYGLEDEEQAFGIMDEEGQFNIASE